MPENNQPIGTDATGFDILTQAVRDLLNRFPGLEAGEEILYETLAADGGIAFSNNAGALVYTDREDICGNVRPADIRSLWFTGLQRPRERQKTSACRNSWIRWENGSAANL